jgi:hypothetical protein
MKKLKYLIRRFEWLKVLNSPFKPFKVKFYAGKLAIGTPYFYPRKLVKFTEEDIQKAMENHRANKNYVQHLDSKLYDMYKSYSKFKPLKVGFDWCSLGYKTKWSDTDFRFEWNPVFTFVFFSYQVALTVYSPYHDHYWTSWLYYEYATDKTKSKRERVEQCRKELNQTWTSHKHDEEPVTTDYYTKILKSKYLK